MAEDKNILNKFFINALFTTLSKVSLKLRYLVVVILLER